MPKGLLPLPSSHCGRFQRREYWPALLQVSLTLYRYGSTREQATSSREDPWVHLSEDCFETSEEVIQNLCLLDATAADLGEFDPAKGVKLSPGALAGGRKPTGEKPGSPWNVAAWRRRFEVVVECPAWFGLAGPMAFDVNTGKRYDGARHSTPHLSRPGGGSQVLVHKNDLTKLRPLEFAQLRRVRYLV